MGSIAIVWCVTLFNCSDVFEADEFEGYSVNSAWHSKKMQSNASSSDDRETKWTLYQTISPQETGFLSLSISYIIIINNAIVLAVFTNPKPFKLCYHIIIGLAVADIMTLIPLAFSVVALIHTCVLLTDQLRNVMGLATKGPVGITSWLQCLLCLEKCMSVRKPMAHRRFSSRRNSATKMKVAVIR